MLEETGLVRFNNVGLRYGMGPEVLRDLTFDIAPQSFQFLTGPSGAGKTTLIKILLGIVSRTAGNATVLGHPAGSMAARCQIGYLPENHRLPRHLSANTALEYYGSLSGMSLSQIRAARPMLLEQVGLKGRERERVSGYSKGMLQRLGLAQAMLHRPQLIVLDEPTDGVDPVGRREIRDVLRQLAAAGHTIFLNSHLLQEIELICDQVAILSKGRLLRTGSVQELTKALKDAPLQLQLFGERSIIEQILTAWPGSTLREAAPKAFEIEVSINTQPDADRLIDALRAKGVSIFRMARRERTLEEVFMTIVEESSR